MSLISYAQYSQIVNLDKVKYRMMVKIAELFVEQGAIIFGGFVRDKYIHDCYARIFYKNENTNEDGYGDESYDPETKHRLLVPKDIDVFVRGNEDDVRKIYSFITEKGFSVRIKRSKVFYGLFKDIHQQKVSIKTMSEIGLPTIQIELDVIYSSDDVKPPFNRLDLWCNSLLMDKNGITVSNQTGSKVDNWEPFGRKILEGEILRDLLKFETKKTEFNSKGLNEQIIIDRIESMKKRGWIIKEEL